MINNNEIAEQVKELRDKNIPVYSISKINSYSSCAYGYYSTYVKKEKGIENIYRINTEVTYIKLYRTCVMVIK